MTSTDSVRDSIRDQLDWDGVSRPIVAAIQADAEPDSAALAAVIVAADQLITRARQAGLTGTVPSVGTQWVEFQVGPVTLEVGDDWVYAAAYTDGRCPEIIVEFDNPGLDARDSAPIIHTENQEWRQVMVRFTPR